MRTAAALNRILASEGLAPLDFPDGAGGIMVGNRGSGKLLDEGRAFSRKMAKAHQETRAARLADCRPMMTLDEQRVCSLTSGGMSVRRVAKRLGMNRGKVWRIVKRYEARERPRDALGEMLANCDATTIVLFFALLERALEAPAQMRDLIGQARAVPEIRALLEPDEVSDG